MKWFSNLKISSRIMSGFLLIAIISTVVGGIGIYYIGEIERLDMEMYETMTVPLGEKVLYTEAYHRMRGNVKDILLTDDPNTILTLENRIDERNREFNDNLRSYQTTLFSDEGRQVIEQLFIDKANYDAIMADVINLSKSGNKEEAIRLMNSTETENLRRDIENAITRAMTVKVSTAEEYASYNLNAAERATRIMIILVIFGLVLSIGLGIAISRSIKKPIYELLENTEKIAEGDLTVKLNVDRSDEIGDLASSFQNMATNMDSALGNINTASEQAAVSSQELSFSSITLSEGITEQASAVEELTAATEEISTQTNQNADNSNEVKKIAEDTAIFAETGSSKMQDMLVAMNEINDSSKNISKIIKVIDEIAFQTNILALNAAVEAARAGQHGKGFAVVAEEVRNLAARSSSAAKETTELIDNSTLKVEEGTNIANETAQALKKIVEGVKSTSDLINSIATASTEQAIGIEQINEGLIQISDVIQNISATSEETSATSQEMFSQAEILREQVSKFKTSQSQTSMDTVKDNNFNGDSNEGEKKENKKNNSIELLE